MTSAYAAPVPRNVKHFQLENNHPSSGNVLNTSPTAAHDHTTYDSNNIRSCNQITDKNLLSSKEIPNCEVVDKFIDDLIEGIETKAHRNTPVSRHSVDVSLATHQECESRQLAPMMLRQLFHMKIYQR